MDCQTFQRLLTQEVSTYKSLLETENNDWIVKGFVDVDKNVYNFDELNIIKSVIEQFIFFVQPKWKIASDRPGSGNTRNIGGIDIDKLIKGAGPFAKLGEDVFDDYWTNFFNATDARTAGLGTPHYHNLTSYKEYLDKQQVLRKKMTRR